MANNGYFQRAARQISSSVPVVQPPRYLTRRMETGHFEGLISMESDFSIHQFPDQTKRQRDFGHNGDVKEVAPLSLNSATSPDGSLSPVSIAVTKQFADSNNFNLGDKSSLSAVSESASAHLFSSAENSYTGYQEETGFLPTQSENHPENTATNSLSSSLRSNTLAQPIRSANFFTTQMEPNALPTQSEHHPEKTLTNTLAFSSPNNILAQTTGLANFFTTHGELDTLSNLSDLSSKAENQWQSPEPEFAGQRNILGSDVSTKEFNMKANSERPTAPFSSGHFNKNEKEAAEKPHSSVTNDEDPHKADSNKAPNAKEQILLRGRASEMDKTEVIIGAVDITVIAPSKAAEPAKLATTSSKLSLARGVTRAYGLRQG